ncbi:hemerythrin family non-heme iron protein [Campylobacter sp. MIT 12-5580]|uniref:bacteriohemerythrin n=1 Tax=Campylobacter sp. MIT 12-5580 TaxID=2040651 RepID=UPI0010F7A1E7|nr:bacteriohemerythrin [Campylobacter sp. MIT 12-5580]TKX30316.1 hemerythrin family non-heme iron protein [Campylobacter sp. MIT 12-5580]
MLPRWDNSYSVYNAKVDEQHKKLFELAAEVERISDRPVSKAEVKDLLAGFFNYMKEHFHDEEKYMQTIGFPDLEPHKKIHKDIIQMMIDLIKDIRSTNDLKEKLYVAAKKWLLEHILFEDMKVAEYRKSLLSSEDGSDVSFEANDEDDSDTQVHSYFYTCACEGKIHDVPFSIHQKIQKNKKKFNCKTCKQAIKFYKTT